MAKVDIFTTDKAMKFTNENKLNMLVSENEKNTSQNNQKSYRRYS